MTAPLVAVAPKAILFDLFGTLTEHELEHYRDEMVGTLAQSLACPSKRSANSCARLLRSGPPANSVT
jgi:FMN phosphatase YigB (HAD superfamily)